MSFRQGLPNVSAHRRFVTAIALDAVGSGVFMPVSVLYFVRTTDVPLERVGVALSLAALVAIPVTLVVGGLVDRLGAKRTLLGANATSALGYSLYGTVDSFAGILAVVTLTAIGMSGFWASFGPLVAAISREGEREKWFGFLGALRNIGFAVGGLVSGVIIGIGSMAAYHAVVWADVASLVASFCLISTISAGRAVPRDERAATASWGVVLRDREYRTLVGVTVVYALASLALNYAMPLYVVERLHLPGWVAGAIFTINTLMCGFGQSPVVARMTGRRRHRIIDASFLTFAVGFVLMALAGAVPTVPAVVIGLSGAVVYTLGEIMAGPVIATLAVDSRPEHVRGRYMAFHQLSWQIASVLAPASFAWLLAQGRVTVWLALIGVMAVGLLLMRVLPRHLPLAAEPVTNAAG